MLLDQSDEIYKEDVEHKERIVVWSNGEKRIFTKAPEDRGIVEASYK